MQIEVAMPYRAGTITLDVKASELVVDVGAKIQDKERIPSDHEVCLTFLGQVLDHDRRLADYNILPDSVLHFELVYVAGSAVSEAASRIPHGRFCRWRIPHGFLMWRIRRSSSIPLSLGFSSGPADTAAAAAACKLPSLLVWSMRCLHSVAATRTFRTFDAGTFCRLHAAVATISPLQNGRAWMACRPCGGEIPFRWWPGPGIGVP